MERDMTKGEILAVLAKRVFVVLVCGLLGLLVTGVTQLELGDGGLVPKAGRYRLSIRLLYEKPKLDAKQQGQAFTFLFLRPLSQVPVVDTQVIAQEASARIDGAYTPEEIMENSRARVAGDPDQRRS
jgi:hypothetical protein